MVGRAIGCGFLVLCGAVFVALGRRVWDGRIAPTMSNLTPTNTTEESWAAMGKIVGLGILVCGIAFIIAGPMMLSDQTANLGAAAMLVSAIYMLVQTARGFRRLEPRPDAN